MCLWFSQHGENKKKMKSYLNSGDDVINFCIEFEKFLPQSMMVSSFI